MRAHNFLGRSNRPPHSASVLLVFAAVAMLSGCNCGQSTIQCNGGTDCASAGGGSATDGGTGGGSGGGGGVSKTLTGITVAPADQTLNLTVLMTGTIAYTAVGTYSDGSSGAVDGVWSLGDTTFGNIDAVGGGFTANGVVAGTTSITFTEASTGAIGTTHVTIVLNDVIIPTGANPPPDGLFTGAGTPVTDPTATATILYPLDNVRFPQNVNAPTVQWNQIGAANDWFRVTYAKPHITIVDYVQNAAGFKFSEQLPDPIFSRLAESDPANQATVTVDHLDVAGNRVVSGTPVHMTFAPGSVSGTVYYWVLDEARLHRIPGGTTQNQAMFSQGITGTATTDPGYNYSSCIACHQISRDGKYLAANGDQSYIFDLTSQDPTLPNMPVATRAGYRWYFSSISPDDRRVFASLSDATFDYTDINVVGVTPTGTLPTGQIAHPNWSPDGKTVAFISNLVNFNGNAAFTGGDLTLVDVDLSTDVFSNLRVIHTGADLATSDPAGGTADCFPSWTPDNKLLMFDHTQNTRGTGDTRFDGSLYIMPPTAGTTPVRMGIASDSAGHPQSHFPNTSPFASGGYYWIVFYSTRDYGNAYAGTAGTTRPQLWVSAISKDFDGTNDPSSVPYWLPGQDTAHENADAVWAASACKATGDTCATSSDCCSGSCLTNGDGGFACTPAVVCRREGESCETSTDCCAGANLTCDPTIHVCQGGLM